MCDVLKTLEHFLLGHCNARGILSHMGGRTLSESPCWSPLSDSASQKY